MINVNGIFFKKRVIRPLVPIIHGPKFLRPHGVRDIPAEMRLIARIVMRLNNMSGQLI